MDCLQGSMQKKFRDSLKNCQTWENRGNSQIQKIQNITNVKKKFKKKYKNVVLGPLRGRGGLQK